MHWAMYLYLACSKLRRFYMYGTKIQKLKKGATKSLEIWDFSWYHLDPSAAFQILLIESFTLQLIKRTVRMLQYSLAFTL